MQIENFPSLIRDAGVGNELMMERYEATQDLFTVMGRVIPYADTNGYGIKGTELESVGELIERPDGGIAADDDSGESHTWRLRIGQYARSRKFPFRMLEQASEGRAINLVSEFTTAYGEQARRDKNKFLAGLLEDGTLTAGSVKYFNNSYESEADPNRGFIYDGLPWFDTAHLINGSSYSNHVPGDTLTEATLASAYTRVYYTNAINSRGERAEIVPDTLVVGPALMIQAEKLLNSVLVPGSANNDANVMARRVQLIVNPYISSATGWWLGKRDPNGIIVVDEAPTVRLVRDDDRGEFRLIAEVHYGASIGNWRYWMNAGKAAS